MEFEYLISLKQRLPLTITQEQLDTLKDMNVEFVIEERIPIDEQVEMVIEDEDVFKFINDVLRPKSMLQDMRLINRYLRAKNYTLLNPTGSNETHLMLIRNIVRGDYKLKLKE